MLGEVVSLSLKAFASFTPPLIEILAGRLHVRVGGGNSWPLRPWASCCSPSNNGKGFCPHQDPGDEGERKQRWPQPKGNGADPSLEYTLARGPPRPPRGERCCPCLRPHHQLRRPSQFPLHLIVSSTQLSHAQNSLVVSVISA